MKAGGEPTRSKSDAATTAKRRPAPKAARVSSPAKTKVESPAKPKSNDLPSNFRKPGSGRLRQPRS